MNVNPINNNNQTFEGKLVQKGAIAKEQRALYLKKKPAIEGMIKELPFDLTVTQNNKSKIISMTTNVEGAKSFVVKKGKHFVEAASAAIEDAKSKSKLYKKLQNANEMLEYSGIVISNIIFGKFKEARAAEKSLAEICIKNFEDYKLIPRIIYRNIPRFLQKMVLINSIKYRIYKAFTKKTPEEKQFMKMKKEYLEELKSQNKKLEVVYIDFPNIY